MVKEKRAGRLWNISRKTPRHVSLWRQQLLLKQKEQKHRGKKKYPLGWLVKRYRIGYAISIAASSANCGSK